MSIRKQLNSIAEERVLVLDGAMGSVIQTLNLGESDFRGKDFANHSTSLAGCNDLLCLTKPQAIGEIHEAYLESGADIIETCSFNATSISLSDYGLGTLAYKISEAAAKIARKSADKFAANAKPRFVAGSIGPTAKGASLYPDVNDPGKRSIVWDELEAAYYDNARGLLDGGADILLVETVFDTLNAKAALFAIGRLLQERRVDVPVIISAAISGESGRLLSGQGLEAFCISVLHAKPWAIGLNCSFNAQKLLPHIRLLAEIAPCFVSAYPNAGLPNRLGRYEETPEIMSANVEEILKEELVNVIGSCCGSTPSHTAAIAEKAALYKPRKIPQTSPIGSFSGLEPLHVKNGEVCVKNAEKDGGKSEFLELLAKGEFEDAVDAVRELVEEGASVVDVQVDNEKAVGGFLDFALMNPYVAKVPFFINSPLFDVLQAGLKRLQGKGFAGPLNLKDGKDEFLRKAQIVRGFGAAAVVTLIDDEKEPSNTYERQIEIAQKIYALLKRSGYPVENVLFMPDASALGASQCAKVCSWIKDNCPGVLIAL
jgi:5-methyltetrahydrofolate--homocysteine methyltransferase